MCDTSDTIHELSRTSSQTQMRRLRQVIEQELTKKQREVILAYYFQDKSITQIAAERGIHKSSVSRCLRNAEERVRRCLRYL